MSNLIEITNNKKKQCLQWDFEVIFFNMHYVHTIRLICITALSLILHCFLNERGGGIDNGK